MTLFDQARATRRPTIRVGRKYQFYSTVCQVTTCETLNKPPNGPLVREYTGQQVRVIQPTFRPGDEDWTPGESERMYRVRADDDTEFIAYQGELNGWFKDTGQFYGPSGVWGSES